MDKARAIRLLCVSVTGFALLMHVLASLQAWGGVLDDVWGILGIPSQVEDRGLLHRLSLEWTQPTYAVASGGASANTIPWGPLTATLWDLVAAAVGRTDIVPFRLLNVGVLVWLLAGAWVAVWRISGVALAGWIVVAVVAVHPLTVETVAWSSDLFDLLGAGLIVWGFCALTYCRNAGHVVLTTFVFVLLAGFAKPTAVVNGLYLPVVLLLLGRQRAWVVGSVVTVVAAMIVHQLLYGMVAVGSRSALAQALAITGSGEGHLSTFLVQLGVQLLQVAGAVGPRVSRLVYAPDSRAPMLALAGYGLTIVAIVVCAMGTLRRVWSRRLGLLLLLLILLWVGTNVPGVLYGMRQKGIGVRYAFMPAVCTVACFVVWAAELRQARLRAFATPAFVLILAAWGSASVERLSAWQSEGSFLVEELRLNGEWQLDGRPHPEFSAFFHFSRVRAIAEGREDPSDALCEHLAGWEAAMSAVEKQPRLYYIENLMVAPRRAAWTYAASLGRCTTDPSSLKYRSAR